VEPKHTHVPHLGFLRAFLLASACCALPTSVVQVTFAANSSGYTVKAPPSVAHIQKGTGDNYKIQAQESRFWLTQDYRRQARFIPRLITTTTNWTRDGSDEDYSVVVTIDEMHGRTPRRIASFSDPGASGQVLAGDVYYLTMKPPCCADSGYYYFRSLDTGKFLFEATGTGEVGTAAFMYVHPPGTHVETDRWVAFEGNTNASLDPTLLGHIRYGDLNGISSDILVRLKSDAPPWPRSIGGWDELAAAKQCGFLQWIDEGKVHSSFGRKRPAPGSCDLKGAFLPEPMDYLAGKVLPHGLNGIEVEFSISGDVYATIPIVNDHLDIDHAHTADRIVLTGLPSGPP